MSQWTEEIFTISQILRRNTPLTYKLKDYENIAILGSFDKAELQKVPKPKHHVIVKVLQTNIMKGVKHTH